MKKGMVVLCALLAVVFPGAGLCLDYESLAVVSGDLLIVKEKNGKLSDFKISCIMAPYHDQQGWGESRAFLEQAAEGKQILLNEKEKTPFGYVGEMLINGRDVCYPMVESGFAWANLDRRGNMLNDIALMQNPLYKIEKDARKKRLGIWAYDPPSNPWNSQARKEEESIPYQIVSDAFAAEDSKKTPYQLCMEEKFGRGFKPPSVTYALAGRMINAASVACGGEKPYKISSPKLTQQQDNTTGDLELQRMSDKLNSIDRRLKYGW